MDYPRPADEVPTAATTTTATSPRRRGSFAEQPSIAPIANGKPVAVETSVALQKQYPPNYHTDPPVPIKRLPLSHDKHQPRMVIVFQDRLLRYVSKCPKWNTHFACLLKLLKAIS